jgi:hypothetical protein
VRPLGDVSGRVIVASLEPDCHAEWRKVLTFAVCHIPNASSDVALLDAPHNTDAGPRSIMGERYGTYRSGELEAVVRAGVLEA